jgi:alkanesulfonate monooxygenase SsuD/methylene tetrahydromethanopterin reductase-like flavin-dependent oxidoreductase (luciferase family)
MKLGLYMATQWRQGADLGPELKNLIEQVRVARASGLSSLMVGQHFVSSPLQMFQAMPLLARLAAEAQGMRLGPGLLLLPLLNPVIVAEETATLDWLCDGNAIIGLGLGYRQEEFDSIGVPIKERVPRFVEAVEVIRKLWRDDTVEHKGRFHTQQGAGQHKAQAAGWAADLDGGRFRGAGQARRKARRCLVPVADGERERRGQVECPVP